MRPYINYLLTSKFSLGATATYFKNSASDSATGTGYEIIAQHALTQNKRFGVNGKYSIINLSNSRFDYKSKTITLGLYYSF